MSWTIERTPENKSGASQLEAAIDAADKAGILMFCAANDQGVASDMTLPAACPTRNIFKIGAAEPSGVSYERINILKA